MKTFLLHFEETVDVENSLTSAGNAADSGKNAVTTVAGTKTLTEVRQEGVDDDPQARSSFAIPK